MLPDWPTHRTRDVLIIIPTYGAFDYARRCAESIVKNTTGIGYVIAVIDDGSDGWDDIRWDSWPATPRICCHFKTNAGLTRSWNEGIKLAATLGFEYTVCGNSDLLYAPFWFQNLKLPLESGYQLVGPVTHAPGHCYWQNAKVFGLPRINDSWASLARIGREANSNRHMVINTWRINGFCMMAKTSTWLAGAYDSKHVFNPKKRLTGNEDELQTRWVAKRWQIGYTPRSYVFHYRSVSRPAALVHKESAGAFRHGVGVIR